MVFLPGSALEGLLCAFDSQRSSFAVCSSGRVRVFCAASGALQTDFSSVGGKNLIENYTTICWGTRPLGKAAQKGLTAEGRLVVLGSATGDVVAYDLATGGIAWRSASVLQGAVGGIAFDANASTFVVTGQDGAMALLESKGGASTLQARVSSHALTAAHCLTGSSQAVLAGSHLHLVNTVDATVECKMSGHSTAVTALSTTPDGSWVLSGAQGDRSVAIFALARKASTKNKVRKAKGHLSVEDTPVCLHTCASDDAEGGSCSSAFHALALTDAGDLYVWRCSKSEGGTMAGTLRARISVGGAGQRGSKTGAHQTLLGAAFEGPNAIMVAKGHATKPDFELVRLSSENDQTILLATRSSGLLLSESAQAASPSGSKPQAMAVGPENSGTAVQRRELANTKKRAQPDAADAVADDFGSAVPTEASLGERVAALAGIEADAGSAAAPQATAATGPVTADSLSVLLTQALRAQDKLLLEKVLSTGNASVIRNTIARLAPTDAALFLKAAVERLQTRPARAGALLPWLRANILAHTAYLSTAPGVQAHLTAVYQLIESRLAVFQPMLALRGRLDLVLAQRSAEASSADAHQQGPLVTVDLADQLHPVEDPYAAGGDSDDDMEGWESAGDDEDGAGGSDASDADSMSEDE